MRVHNPALCWHADPLATCPPSCPGAACHSMSIPGAMAARCVTCMHAWIHVLLHLASLAQRNRRDSAIISGSRPVGDAVRVLASVSLATHAHSAIPICHVVSSSAPFPQVDRATDGRGRSGVVDLAIDPRLASADAAPGIDRQAAPGHDSRRTGSCPRCSPPWARSIPCSDRQECPACSFPILFPLRRRGGVPPPLRRLRPGRITPVHRVIEKRLGSLVMAPRSSTHNACTPLCAKPNQAISAEGER